MKKPPDENACFRTREEQAEKIIRVIADYLKSGLQDLFCLDIGCSNGIMSGIFRTQYKQVVAFDVNKTLVNEANESFKIDGIYYLIADGEQIPFPDESFDLIICAQIYEHTQEPEALASEIFRVLRKNGICFFSGPNRLFIIEQHYRLPFLSWLPKTYANQYMRLFRRGSSYGISPLNYWQLRRLLRKFVIHDYTVKIISDPERFGLHDRNIVLNIAKLLPQFFLSSYPFWIPNFNWILVKRENDIHTDNLTHDSAIR